MDSKQELKDHFHLHQLYVNLQHLSMKLRAAGEAKISRLVDELAEEARELGDEWYSNWKRK